jgi:uncharacterized protein
MKRLRVAWLPDGKRLHLRNGPINLIIQAFGQPAQLGRAYDAGIERARELVTELAEDLPRLQAQAAPLTAVGLRAAAAVQAVPATLAPVTALTGAIADEVLTAMAQAGRLDRGFVNNHGVVSFHLGEGQSLTPQAMDWPEFSRYDSTRVPITTAARTRGMAAGGWHYQGFAFGCVDRVYTASTSAAGAEAVLGSISTHMRPAPGVARVQAGMLEPESVLGGLEVYPPSALTPAEVAGAMAQGRKAAESLFATGTATLALITLDSESFLVAPPQFNLRSMLRVEM